LSDYASIADIAKFYEMPSIALVSISEMIKYCVFSEIFRNFLIFFTLPDFEFVESENEARSRFGI